MGCEKSSSLLSGGSRGGRPPGQGRCVGPQGPAGERTSQLPGCPSPPASLPFAILTLVNAPYKRGFYCGDDSIRYPYRPDTITHGLMAGVTITATIVLVRQEGLRGTGEGMGWGTALPWRSAWGWGTQPCPAWYLWVIGPPLESPALQQPWGGPWGGVRPLG